MALGENEGMSTTMLVSPAGGSFNAGYAYPAPVYCGGNNGGGLGFGGGDWGSLITLFLLFGLFGGGFGGMGGGFGGFGGYDFPWILNGQQGINNNVSSGFRDAQINDGITSVRDGISGLSTQLCNCCGDVQMSLANGFNGVNTSINAAQNALTQQAYANQIADMERSYAAQTAQAQGFNAMQAQLAQCCCDNRLGTEQLRATVLQENCADRYEAAQNTQSIISTLTAGIQSIKNELCADRLDAARRENDQLRTELIFARGQASQVDQTAQLRASQATVANQLVQELRSCPIPAQPVYGNTPIFTCAQNVAGGCGCNGSFNLG